MTALRTFRVICTWTFASQKFKSKHLIAWEVLCPLRFSKINWRGCKSGWPGVLRARMTTLAFSFLYLSPLNEFFRILIVHSMSLICLEIFHLNWWLFSNWWANVPALKTSAGVSEEYQNRDCLDISYLLTGDETWFHTLEPQPRTETKRPSVSIYCKKRPISIKILTLTFYAIFFSSCCPAVQVPCPSGHIAIGRVLPRSWFMRL